MVYYMKNCLKVVTIGGGSSYTPELIEGFIKRHEELPVKELWLVDIEEGKEKLEIVGRHDPCIVQRAVPVIEAVAAIGILDLIKEK